MVRSLPDLACISCGGGGGGSSGKSGVAGGGDGREEVVGDGGVTNLPWNLLVKLHWKTIRYVCVHFRKC